MVRIPFSQRIGFATVVESTRSSLTGSFVRAMRPAKPIADRHTDALADLLLDAACRPGHEIAGVLVEKQHRSRVGIDDAAHPLQKLDEQVLDVQSAQLAVGDRPEVVQLILRAQVTGIGIHQPSVQATWRSPTEALHGSAVSSNYYVLRSYVLRSTVPEWLRNPPTAAGPTILPS